MPNPTFAFTLTVVGPGGEPVDIIATPAFTDKTVQPGESFEIPFTLSKPATITDANWMEPLTDLISSIGVNDTGNAVVIVTTANTGSVSGTIELVVG